MIYNEKEDFDSVCADPQSLDFWSNYWGSPHYN